MSDRDPPYTRIELESLPDGFPERGPVCPRCGAHIPQFAELNDADKFRIKMLILNNQKILAIEELKAATGCSTRWAKIWVLHSGETSAINMSVPCPYCGKALRTALAKQCPHCLMDWHNEENPK